MLIDKLIGGGTATTKDGTEVNFEVLVSMSFRGDDTIKAEIYEDNRLVEWEYFNENIDYEDVLSWADEYYNYTANYQYFEEDEAE